VRQLRDGVPTSGRPYVDKPRLYLDRADFEAQSRTPSCSSARVIEGGSTRHTGSRRTDGATTAPGASGGLDRDTFAVVEATPTGAAEGESVSLEPAAVMATLLAGVTGSLPHVPTAAEGGTRVIHPGYAE
jgi:hypothetical protein